MAEVTAVMSIEEHHGWAEHRIPLEGEAAGRSVLTFPSCHWVSYVSSVVKAAPLRPGFIKKGYWPLLVPVDDGKENRNLKAHIDGSKAGATGQPSAPAPPQPDRTELLFMTAGGLPSWECKFTCIIFAERNCIVPSASCLIRIDCLFV